MRECPGEGLKEDEGNMATSSAWAVGSSERSLPSGEIPELAEDHQSPVGSRCTRAYFRLCTRVSLDFVDGGIVPEGLSWVSWEMMLSTLRGTGAE